MDRNLIIMQVVWFNARSAAAADPFYLGAVARTALLARFLDCYTQLECERLGAKRRFSGEHTSPRSRRRSSPQRFMAARTGSLLQLHAVRVLMSCEWVRERPSSKPHTARLPPNQTPQTRCGSYDHHWDFLESTLIRKLLIAADHREIEVAKYLSQ